MIQGKELSTLTPRQALQAFLMCSYLYYIRYQSVVGDEDYDGLSKLLRECWGGLEHPHKALVTLEDLAAGSLYKLREEDYPMIVKQAAEIWLRDSEEGKVAGD